MDGSTGLGIQLIVSLSSTPETYYHISSWQNLNTALKNKQINVTTENIQTEIRIWQWLFDWDERLKHIEILSGNEDLIMD